MTPTRRRASLLAVLLLAAGCGSGDEPTPPSASKKATAQPEPDGDTEHHSGEELGTVAFSVSCAPEAQAEFNRAAAFLHSFSFAPAIEGFKKVVELDETCAMGHWGEAMSLLGNPFAWPPGPPALADGQSAVGRAVAAGATTPRERSYIDAVGTFYRDADTVEHAARAVAYAEAMGTLVEQYPEDTEARIFYALALDATAVPTDKTYANQQRAAEILEDIAADQPDHPGVAHYLIHSYDYPASAERGREAARRYAKIAPAVSHALHMPSHIFTRLGDWDESIRSNVAAAKSAREELTAGHQQGFGSYNALHALDYLMYAYLQRGQDEAAQGVLDEITGIDELDVQNLAAAYAFAVIPARYALERGRWAEAAQLTLHPPTLDWKRFPQAEAASAFARGLGAARSGDAVAARAEMERIGAVKTALAAAKQAYWAGQAEIQVTAVAAWAELADGHEDDALRLMRSAAEQEAATEKHPVMPGPLVPARELLGEMLIELGQPVDALAEFEASHRVEPDRFRGLHGAARAAEIAGEGAKARKYYERLVSLTRKGDGQRPEVAEAKTYLSEAE